MNTIPPSINRKILAEIKNRLNPDLKTLLLKLFAIHLMTAIITMSICPQMGFSLFKTRLNLMNTFMAIGPHFCDFACGAFFTSMSMITAFFILSRDELRLLRHRQLVTCLIMLLPSTGFLLMLSPLLFVQFSILWFLGSLGGVLLGLQLGGRVLRFQ
jgi:hypothetical protein